MSSAARLTHQPFFVERGKGSRLFDVDGNEYIDYVLGYGPLILGHAPEPIIEAIQRQVSRGTLFGTGFEEEYLLAEELVRLVPCADLVRFCNSGSEALQFVLRLARAYTGRNKIIKFEGHYHGWTDEIFISVKPTPPMGLPHSPWKKREVAGQPEDAARNLIILPWNDLEIIEKTLIQSPQEIAAIILEPVMFYHGGILPKKGYLEGLRALADHYRVVLIFDEVVTGFRLALGGAQEYFGVVPDLCAFAKGFAAGLPMAAFGGKRKIMDLVASNAVPHMGTYNGNALCVAGALAAVRELTKDDGKAIKRMIALGAKLKEGLNRIFADTGHPIRAVGCDSIFSVISPPSEMRNYRDTLNLDFQIMQRFYNDMMAQGVWFMGRGNFMLSAAHTEEDINQTLSAADRVLKSWKK